MNEDAERFSRRFNDSQNKGYLYAANLVGRKEGRKEIVIALRRIIAAKCLSRLCVATVKVLLNV